MPTILQDWAVSLQTLVTTYREDHIAAPTYGYRSKLTRQQVQSKYQIKMEFLDNLMEMSILCDDDIVSGKIDALIAKYEKQR